MLAPKGAPLAWRSALSPRRSCCGIAPLRSAMAGAGVERDEPWGRGVRCAVRRTGRDFVFTTAMSGVIAIDEGVPRVRFDLRRPAGPVGSHRQARLNAFGLGEVGHRGRLSVGAASVDIRPAHRWTAARTKASPGWSGAQRDASGVGGCGVVGVVQRRRTRTALNCNPPSSTTAVFRRSVRTVLRGRGRRGRGRRDVRRCRRPGPAMRASADRRSRSSRCRCRTRSVPSPNCP